jgi:hypothetical protein
MTFLIVLGTLLQPSSARAGDQLGPEHVLLVYNSAVPDSVAVRDLYLQAYPGVRDFDIAADGCQLTGGNITRQQYLECIRNPIRDHLNGTNGGPDISREIVVILTTRGVPARITGANEFGGLLNSTFASVDSELTLLQQDLEASGTPPLSQRHFGIVDNPYHALVQPILSFPRTRVQLQRSFQQVSVPGGPASWVATDLTPGNLYLVCRLDAAPGEHTTPVQEIARLLTRSPNLTVTRCEAQFLLDAYSAGANMLDEGALPPSFPGLADYPRTNTVLVQAGFSGQLDRTFDFLTGPELDDTTRPLFVLSSYGENHDVGGRGEDPPGSGTYINTYNLHPAAIFLSIESFNGNSIINGQPRGGQGQVLDIFPRGGSFTIGHVAEPFTFSIPDTEYLARAMIVSGLTFAEAAWIATPGLSWQQTPVGDPLARIQVLDVSSPDQNRDGIVDVEDLYLAERQRLDLTCDGTINDDDRRLVLDAVRAGELADTLP